MAKAKTTDVLVKLIDLLTPLETEERTRLISAALTVLGDAHSPAHKEVNPPPGDSNIAVSTRARNWLKQNSLTTAEIEQVFHIDGGKVEVIASSAPGNNDKERTLNAYVLAGIAALLEKDDPKFDDKSARGLCKSLGCLNQANHATYLKDKSNDFTGSKSAGWQLTAPGLKKGAALIKGLTKSDG